MLRMILVGIAAGTGFAIGAAMLVLLGLPQKLEILKRYRGHPKTDIILGMLSESSFGMAGAFVSAWVGHFLVLLLKS